MTELLDYILDYNDNFWIVEKIDNEIKGYMVYEVSDEGKKYNNITKKNYIKSPFTGFRKIPVYKKLFKPNEFYLEKKTLLTGVWKKYVEALNKIGIEDKDIGIFGSYLVGFDITKDVDFVIYGKDNLRKYYDNNEFIKKYTNATYINDKHIEYQYNKHKSYHHPDTDLLEIIKRNWSGIQVDENVLSTPRFIDRENQHSIVDSYDRRKVIFEVLDGLNSSMLPRSSKVIYNDQEYIVQTNLWKFQSFLKKGDIVECYACVNEDLKTILLPEEKCYLKFIKKGKDIF